MRVLAQITPSAPWGIPMVYTHYVPAFAKYDEEQGYQAVCGAAASDADFSTEPTCPDCQAYLEAPAVAVDSTAHAAQAIHVASGDLLDIALNLTDARSARALVDLTTALRARLDAVCECSAQKYGELTQEATCPF